MTNSCADGARSDSGARSGAVSGLGFGSGFDFAAGAGTGSGSGTGSRSGALPAVVHAWVDGWARARGTDAPRQVPGGFRIEVGRPHHLARYVLPTADPAVLRRLVDGITTPGLGLKVCAPREAVAPALTPAWEISDPQYLMTSPLAVPPTRPLAPPPGYRLDVSHQDDGTLDARVLACEETGSADSGATPVPAASGRVALVSPTGHRGAYRPSAVFDMIGTDAAHRRRGLGRVVMAALAAHAVELGAVEGVLVASPDGRELYRALGWRLRAPVTAAVIPARS
ncbi:GNAT family N-acetyltransferase [Streptomyces sp. NPDC101393]|uniref:GNAT family N-acetyltransferase n=1 Tax=Streptomyces sp. NPDC101393 TaxID=3366141 RepID=UPI00382E47A4